MSARKTSLSKLGNIQGVTSGGDALNTALADENFYLPFSQYLTISTNVTQTIYQSGTLTLPVSQSERLWIEFPKGCAGLVGFQLWHGVEQIFPLPAGNWFKSDGFVFNFRLSHLWNKEPYSVEARAYNLDDTYSHTIWYSLELRGIPKGISKTMQSFLKTLQG